MDTSTIGPRVGRVGPGAALAVGIFFITACQAQIPVTATVPMTLDHDRMLVDGEMQRADGSWRPARLWVDTGNPDLFLSEALARDLGLDLSAAKGGVEGGRLEMQTPAGLRLGGMPLDLDGVRTYVMFEPGWLFSTMHNDANLPSSVLRHYQVAFDYPAREVTVAQPGAMTSRGVAVPAEIHPETGIVQMDAVIAGESFSFALDVGASFSFTSERMLEAFALEHPDWPTMQGAIGHANMWGWWPQEEAWTVMRIPRIDWGGATLSDVGLVGPGEIFGPGFDLATWYSQKTARPVDGFLGPSAVRGHRVEIDYPNATVYFEKGPNPVPPDMDMVGLTLRPEADGGWTVLGIAAYDGQPSVPGVEAGDHLLQVDGLATTDATMGTVVDALWGDPGEIRVLILEREGERLTVEAVVRRFLPPAPDYEAIQRRAKTRMDAVAEAFRLSQGDALATTVEEVIARHLEVVGGREALDTIQTMVVRVAVHGTAGRTMELVRYYRRPMSYRQETVGTGTGSATDGRRSWQIGPPGWRGVEGNPFLFMASIDGHLVDYQPWGVSYELLGVTAMDGDPGYRVRRTWPSGSQETLFFSAMSGLLTAVQGPYVIHPASWFSYWDYRDLGGVRFPFITIRSVGELGPPHGAVVESVEINVNLPDTLFTPPWER